MFIRANAARRFLWESSPRTKMVTIDGIYMIPIDILQEYQQEEIDSTTNWETEFQFIYMWIKGESMVIPPCYVLTTLKAAVCLSFDQFAAEISQNLPITPSTVSLYIDMDLRLDECVDFISKDKNAQSLSLPAKILPMVISKLEDSDKFEFIMKQSAFTYLSDLREYSKDQLSRLLRHPSFKDSLMVSQVKRILSSPTTDF